MTSPSTIEKWKPMSRFESRQRQTQARDKGRANMTPLAVRIGFPRSCVHCEVFAEGKLFSI